MACTDSAEAFRSAFFSGTDIAPHQDEGIPDILTAAAVLVPVVDRPTGLGLLLTRRTAHLRDHAGQISFPGGRAEAGESPEETALREAEEEVGLDRARVTLLGRLPTYKTATGFAISPIVGLVSPPFSLRLDSFEVAEAFEPPLSYVLDPHRRERREILFQGRQRSYWVMTWHGYQIWGATAGILVSLGNRLGLGLASG